MRERADGRGALTAPVCCRESVRNASWIDGLDGVDQRRLHALDFLLANAKLSGDGADEAKKEVQA